MSNATHATSQPNWYLIAGIVTTIALIFFWPYLSLIAFSAIMAYCFLRPYRWLCRHMSERAASLVTMVLTVAAIVVPLSLILLLAIIQGSAMVKDLSASIPPETTATFVNNVNAVLSVLNSGQPVTSEESAQDFIVKTIPEVVDFLLSTIVNIASNTTVLMTSSIIYGFLVSAFLVKSTEIRQILKTISPFEDKTSEEYLHRGGSIIKGSLIGQLAIAFILGVSNAALMFIIGLGEYFFFFVIIYTVLSLVPLGTGIIVMPLGIIAMLTGNIWGGFWMLFLYLVVVCNMDNFLRPRLIPKDARISPALLTVSAFSGLYYFGLIGIVYGPFIAIMIFMTLDVYLEYRNGIRSKTA